MSRRGDEKRCNLKVANIDKIITFYNLKCLSGHELDTNVLYLKHLQNYREFLNSLSNSYLDFM